MTEDGNWEMPAIADGVAWIEVEGDIVALDPDSVEVHLISGTGALIWHRIDGADTIDAIVSDLADRFAAPRETINRDVRAFVAHATGLGLVNCRTENTVSERAT